MQERENLRDLIRLYDLSDTLLTVLQELLLVLSEAPFLVLETDLRLALEADLRDYLPSLLRGTLIRLHELPTRIPLGTVGEMLKERQEELEDLGNRVHQALQDHLDRLALKARQDPTGLIKSYHTRTINKLENLASTHSGLNPH